MKNKLELLGNEIEWGLNERQSGLFRSDEQSSLEHIVLKRAFEELLARVSL